MTAKLFKGAEFLVREATKDDVFTPEEFTDEQRQIGATVEQFVAEQIAPRREEIEQQDFSVILDLLRQCGELGLLMMDVPAHYGGLDLDKASSMFASEKLAPTGSFFVTCGVTSNLGTQPLLYYGTDDQKNRYLSKLATGEWVGAYCLTEPDSGSDALGAKTAATLSADGSCYLLNGAKQFITNGSIANLFTVFAKVDREHFTAFLVERTFPGISVGAEEKKLGIKGSSTTPVVFENVPVPVGNILGEVGKGHKIAFNILNLGRLKVATGTVGTAKSAFADGVAYANLRKQFKVPISSFGAMQEKIADMAAAIFASESVAYRLAGQIDARAATIGKESANYYELYQKCVEEYTLECSIAKVFCTEVLAQVVDEVVQIHGGYGFIQEYSAERYYRDERINRIFEGTNEINRILVTTLVLRRIAAGDIQLDLEVAKALEELNSLDVGKTADPHTFVAEKKLLVRQKKMFLLLIDAAVKKHEERVKDEQEILMALADIAINAFALESVILRAEKVLPGSSDSKREVVKAAVEVFAFNSSEKCGSAIRRGANYLDDGEGPLPLQGKIFPWTVFEAPALLQAKRRLANAAIEREKFPF